RLVSGNMPLYITRHSSCERCLESKSAVRRGEPVWAHYRSVTDKFSVSPSGDWPLIRLCGEPGAQDEIRNDPYVALAPDGKKLRSGEAPHRAEKSRRAVVVVVRNSPGENHALRRWFCDPGADGQARSLR